MVQVLGLRVAAKLLAVERRSIYDGICQRFSVGGAQLFSNHLLSPMLSQAPSFLVATSVFCPNSFQETRKNMETRKLMYIIPSVQRKESYRLELRAWVR